MIEIYPLMLQVPRCSEIFPCFVHGCQQEASHVAKMRHRDVVVQVCLCRECLRKSPQVILESLGIRSQKILN
jgi:hypothetical protein